MNKIMINSKPWQHLDTLQKRTLRNCCVFLGKCDREMVLVYNNAGVLQYYEHTQYRNVMIIIIRNLNGFACGLGLY